MIENKKYFIDKINSSKANKMTALYHYSGVGFKKAILNLGIFRKEDNKMVGVLQWGCSFQEGIRLDRYVKEPITKEEYLELNRFSMADSEGPNSESQAISLGIKWIKQNMPQIKLLVSYAGRKEGNYGYIYQATNWEYLGYFVSEGFWFVDGQEHHLVTLWKQYKLYGDHNLKFTDALCQMYQDVRKTWTKQFIYIQRLDKTLTPASEILPYPKQITDYPIKTREKIYKQNDDIFNSFSSQPRQLVEYYYEPNERLFTIRTLKRRGEWVEDVLKPIAVYRYDGILETTYPNIKAIKSSNMRTGILKSLSTGKSYKNQYYRYYEDEPFEEIDVPLICIIDEIPFNSYTEAGIYLGVSKQAVHQAYHRKATSIAGKNITWF